MKNIMNEYIKIVKSNMNKYLKVFVDNKYVKNIADEFIDTYTDIRYYGLIEVKKGFTVKNKILTELRKKKEKLLEENKDKEKNINIIYDFFDSAIAFNEIKENNIEDEINQVIKLRKIHFLKNDDEDYKDVIRDLVKKCGKDKEKLLKLTETNKFFLKYSNNKISNLKSVVIKQNLKFPAIYSKQAIAKAFNTGVIAEDKLFVEYNLIVAQIIRDIESGIYRKQYIVEFPESILDKSQKMQRLLDILNHPSVQDRVMLNIEYKAINKYKEKIYEILRNGYKIAAVLDNSFEVNATDIQKLSMFQYVLISPKISYYDELVKRKIKNLVEI